MQVITHRRLKHAAAVQGRDSAQQTAKRCFLGVKQLLLYVLHDE